MKINNLFKLAAISAVLAATALAAPIWPNWKYDQQLTGRCPYVGPTIPAFKWAFDTGDTITMRYSAPVIGENGTIYFAGQDSFVFAVTPAGQEKWRYKTAGGIPNPLALDARGRIYVSVSNLVVVAMDDSVTYPKIAWTWGRYIAGSGGSPIVVGPDRTVYACFDSMYAIDSTGARKWAMNRGEGSARPPAISRDGQYLYCEYCPDPFTDALLKLNTSGSQVWVHNLGGAPMDLTWGSPAIGTDSSIYIVTGGGGLHAVRPNNTDKWAPVTGLGSFMYQTPTLGLNDTLWVINRQKRPVYRKFSPGNGAKIFEDSITVSPSRYNYYNSFITDALGQAYIILRDSTGGADLAHLYAFNRDGTVKWIYPLPSPILMAMPALGPDSTIYVCNGHYLFGVKQSAIAVDEWTKRSAIGQNLVIKPSVCRAGMRLVIMIPGKSVSNSVRISNAAGQIIRTLVASAGSDRSFTWDTRDSRGRTVEPGVYFCRFKDERHQQTGKIIVVQ